MKIIKHAVAIFSVVFAIITSQAASAYMQLNYKADEIAWNYALLYGNPDSEVGTYDRPSFALSFKSSLDELSATKPTVFNLIEPDVTFEPQIMQNPYLSAGSRGSVTVNPDGTIRSWNFILKLSELEPTRSNGKVNIQSRGGLNTCNCDEVLFKQVLWTQVTHQIWYRLGPMEIFYKDMNSADNWTVQHVMEPQAWSMMIFALGFIGLLKLKREQRI
ncbi:MAG: hypothetical protein EOO07_07085 [Chitinophagaceae bacterium]|nr:MAG: hypothetical protein EOO07_07085 [Chitinophagaceae bacterium]